MGCVDAPVVACFSAIIEMERGFLNLVKRTWTKELILLNSGRNTLK